MFTAIITVLAAWTLIAVTVIGIYNLCKNYFGRKSDHES